MSTSMLAVFRVTPGATSMALWSLGGRFGYAMTNVALLLFVQARTGSYGVAGAVSAASLLGTAAGMVGQGRLIDRYGPTRPLIALSGVYGVLGTVSIVGIAVDLSPWVLAGLVATASAALPAVAVASRTMWPHLIPAGPVRETAYGYEAISFELCWLTGPGVAALLATLLWPGSGLVAAVVLATVGAVGFALTAVVRSKRQATAREVPAGPRPVVDRAGFATLLLGAAGFGLGIGAVVVSVAAGTAANGVPQAAGVLLAAWSASSIVGGLLYQRWPWAGRRATRLPLLMGAFALVLFLPTVVDGVLALGALVALAGLTLVPQITAHNTLLDGLVPGARLTEAYGLVTTTIAVANAGGQTAAGLVIDRSDHRIALVAAGLCVFALAVGVWFYRDRLVPPPPAV
jgi:hypothetical protein